MPSQTAAPQASAPSVRPGGGTVPGSTGVYLDHLAIGVARFSDAYGRFVAMLGGSWVLGGSSGQFATSQLSFGRGMLLELIAPDQPGGFMSRFLERSGPSAHHLTFKVASFDTAAAALTDAGFSLMGGGRDLPFWREAFVHPNTSPLGTLVQIVEADEAFFAANAHRNVPPGDMPEPATEVRGISFVGLTAADLERARVLLVRVLNGVVTESGGGWFVVSWGPGRSVVVRQPSVNPGGSALWARAPREGVAFVVFGGPDLSVAELGSPGREPVLLPHDPSTGTPVWLSGPPSRTSQPTATR